MEKINDVQDRMANIKRLLAACNDVAGVIADDVEILKGIGNDDEIDNKLQMLGSKKNKIYERFLSLIREIKHFKILVDLSKELDEIPLTSKSGSVIEEEVKPTKVKRNIQDFVS